MDQVGKFAESDLMRELDEACSKADDIVARIQKRLDAVPPSLLKRFEFPLAVRRFRRQRLRALLAADSSRSCPLLKARSNGGQKRFASKWRSSESGFKSPVWQECGNLCTEAIVQK